MAKLKNIIKGCPAVEKALETYYYTSPIDHDPFGFINAIKLAIIDNSRFIVPAIIEENENPEHTLGLSPDGYTYKFGDGFYATTPILHDGDLVVIPVFTSVKEMEKAWVGGLVEIPLPRIIEIASGVKGCNTILINSNGQAVPIPIERLQEIIEDYEPRQRVPILRSEVIDLPCDAIVYFAKNTESGVQIPDEVKRVLRDGGKKLSQELDSEEFDYIMMFPTKGIRADKLIIVIEDEYEEEDAHQALCNCYCWALSFAKDNGLRCIGFDGFPEQYLDIRKDIVATIALTAINGWLKNEDYIFSAYICCKNEEDEAEYLSLFSSEE